MAKKKPVTSKNIDAEIERMMAEEVMKEEQAERMMEERMDELDEEDAEYKKIARKLKKQPPRKRGHDSIFYGKREDPVEETYGGMFIDEVPRASSLSFDQTFDYFKQSTSSMEISRDIKLQDAILEMLINDLGVEFVKTEGMSNEDPKSMYHPRRKPSKRDFNEYFAHCVGKLDTKFHTLSQIFYHLSYYFSDKLMNMFKLLDRKWADAIIDELTELYRFNKEMTVMHVSESEGQQSERVVNLDRFEPQ